MRYPVIVPEDRGNGHAAATSFIRAIGASLIAANNGRAELPEVIARRNWPADRDARTIIKGPSAPAEIGNAGWAGVLGHTGYVVDLISLLAPSSASAAVLKRCLSFTWPSGTVGMNIPTITVNSAVAGWIGEGQPVPVWDFLTSVAQLTPRKIATAIIFSREMATLSTPNIEALLKAALSESLGWSLDRALFSAAPGDSVTPAGLFAGISATAPANGSIPSENMAEDLSRLTAAVASVSGNNPVLLVMAPRQAAAMKVRTDIGQFETYASPALPDGTVCALASNALASVGDEAPTFDVSAEAAMHVVDGGTPAAPQRALFQTDCLALRLRYSINWCLRSSQGVAFTQGVTW
jgi:hypothetical protein